MNGLLHQAVLNNAHLCAAVHEAHGHQSSFTQALWSTGEQPLPYYPNAVTLAPGAQGAVDAFCGHAELPPVAWGVKDSYADLCLPGFRPVVDARWWMVRPRRVSNRGWRKVTSATELAQWEFAWGGKPGFVQFPVRLLDTPGVAFWVLRREGQVAGCLSNATEGVVGLSNVFGTLPGCWSLAVDLLGDVYPDLPVVGWERDPEAVGLADAGGIDLGPLRVWLRLTPG